MIGEALPLLGAPAIMRFEVVVHGVARPQGSKTAVVVGKVLQNIPGRRVLLNPKAVMLEGKGTAGRQAFEGWRYAVATEARRWCRAHPTHRPWDVPLEMTLIFALPRPLSTPRRVVWCPKKPDIDKLERSVMDALSKIIYVDDALICVTHKIKKYADGPPFASIRIQPLELP